MDWLTLSILGIVTIFTFIVLWFKHSDTKSAHEFAQRKLKFVKFGNLFTTAILRKRIELLKHEAIKREGTVFGFNMLGKPTVMLAEPDIIQTVLSKEFTNFTNRREFPAFNKTLSENVFFVQNEQWKRLRSIITPAFSVGKLKRMKPVIDETIERLVKNMDAKIKENQIQNVKRMFEAFTMDTIVQVAFGLKLDSLNDPKNPIIVYGRKLMQTDPSLMDMVKIVTVFFAPKLAKLLKIDLMSEEMDFFSKISTDIINQKREEFAKMKSHSKANSFIEFVLEAEEECRKLNEAEANGIDLTKPAKYMTNDEIVSQCMVFFLAGFDTTATALTLAVHRLAQNPDIQDKLYHETISLLDKLREENSDNESDPYKLITYDSLPKFEYAAAVIDEALRIDSPIIFLERSASKDMDLANEDGSISFSLKKGDMVHIPVFTLHQDKRFFPEPDRFQPERFIGEPQHHKYAYLPFGSGPRNCVARSMALMEARLALIHVVRHFKFEMCPQTKVPLEVYNNFDLNTPKEATLRVVSRG